MSILDNANARIYELDGHKYPSVTTILGILQKPALVPWAAKMTAESVCEQLDEKYLLPHDGVYVIPIAELTSVLDFAKSAHRAKSAKAMQHGTLVHEAIAFWIDSNGKAGDAEVMAYLLTKVQGLIYDRIDAAMMGFHAFLAWADSNDLEIINSEQVVSDFAFYAGRYDLLAKLNGKLVLIDIKTSTGIWDEYWLQCAAYASAAFEELPDAIGVLRIDKESGEIEYQERLDYHHEIEAFNMLAIAYHHLQALKPAKKGAKRGNNNQ